MDVYARVAVNVPVRRLFDYRVPPALVSKVAPGWRVRVPFHGRSMVGYVVRVTSEPEAPPERIKPLQAVVDTERMVPDDLLRLAGWMSRKTFASVGECLEAMLPAGVRLRRQRRRERFVRLVRPASEMENELRAEIVRLEPRYPRRALLLRLLMQHEEQLVRAAPADAGALPERARELPLRGLLAKAQASESPLATLERSGLVTILHREPDRELLPDAIAAEDRFVPDELTFEQQAAEARLVAALRARLGPEATAARATAEGAAGERAAGERANEARRVPTPGGSFLLHGVTGSGKTEVYLRAIRAACDLGLGSIVLVPEIALTPQLVQRFASRFKRIAVLHSSLSDADRGDAWRRVRRGEVDVVIGPRSAVFAPFERLGLIVLDEEHEPSYKQESTPRYHARDVALLRGRLTGAVVVLGSATPALESWQRAHPPRGEVNPQSDPPHALLRMPSRVSGRPMPPITLIDMRQENQEQHRRAIFSRYLLERMDGALRRQEQVILFLNRRGYSTYVHCSQCGYTQQCSRCAINMTFHRQLQRSWCHYCGDTQLAPESCPDCGNPGVRYWGFGTERIAEELAGAFPEARLERMDSDTMTTRGAYEQAFRRLRSREVDILMGTQMIAKGLDLPNVTLVGVLYADIALAFPDFRSAERTFQLIAQVAGRAGRGDKGGEVLVQCFRPDHYAIAAAKDHDYERFAREELEFRRSLSYPPFGHLVRVLVESEDRELTKRTGDLAAQALAATRERAGIDLHVLGPTEAPIAKLKGRFRWHLLVKLASEEAVTKLGRVAGDLLVVDVPRRARSEHEAMLREEAREKIARETAPTRAQGLLPGMEAAAASRPSRAKVKIPAPVVPEVRVTLDADPVSMM